MPAIIECEPSNVRVPRISGTFTSDHVPVRVAREKQDLLASTGRAWADVAPSLISATAKQLR
jgi:hypothetical protein